MIFISMRVTVGPAKLLAQMELEGDSAGALSNNDLDFAFAWNLKSQFPAGQDPDALMVEKDITERGDDY
jgi:flagellar biosynthesis protein